MKNVKTPEDEAFEELARKQGAWGGGFPAKRAMAADKLHWSDCAVHNAPAYPAGECDCGVAQEPVRKVLKLALEALETERDIYCEHDEDGAPEYILDAITSIKEALAQPAQEPEMLTIVYQSGYYDGKKAAQRPWVGLTEKEAKSFINFYKMDIVRFVEAKLKEKNFD
jgi:hypothetical protein